MSLLRSPDATVPDDPEEVLSEADTRPGDRWWRLQVFGTVLLTCWAARATFLYYVQGWSAERIGEANADLLLAAPVPNGLLTVLWMVGVLLSLALPVLTAYLHGRELSRHGVELRVWLWPALALFAINFWPLQWVILYQFRRFRQGVSE